MGKNISNSVGTIEIDEEVIANIAGTTAVECFGLVGMASRKLTDGIAELLGKESLAKGIEVKTEEGRVVIELYVIVAYGVPIPEVARNVMERVKYAVENYTGLAVDEVNINVQGVKFLK